MKKLSVSIFALFCIFFVCFCSITVYGANIDYLSEDKWENNPKVKTVDLNRKTPENAMYGRFSYVKDNENLCLYTRISAHETSLNLDGSDDIRLSYEVRTEREEYTFSLTNGGMTEDMGQSDNVFITDQNIYTEGDRLQALSFVQLTEDAKYCKFTVYLFVNNSRYLIAENIRLVKPVTTKQEKTTVKKKPKTTTKKTYNRTTARKRKEYSSATKKYDKDISTTSVKKLTTAKTKISDNTSDTPLSVQVERNRTIVLAIAGLLLAIGFAIFGYCAGRMNRKDREAAEKESENNEDNE